MILAIMKNTKLRKVFKSIMKPTPDSRTKATLGRVVALLSIALFSSTLTVHSAEDITDAKSSKYATKLGKQIAKITDVQKLIESASNGDKYQAQHYSIIRLGELEDAAGAPVLWSLVENPKIREDVRVLATKSLGQISSPEYFEKLNFGPCLNEKYALFSGCNVFNF